MKNVDEYRYEIVKHYKGFTKDRIRAIRLALEENNIYQARDFEEDLAKGLDYAGNYLLHPDTFILKHNEKEYKWCT